MTDNRAYDSSTGTPPPYSQTWQDPPPPYTPYNECQSQVVTVSRSVFHDGARFNDPSRPTIPPPAPGYEPNALQRAAMHGPVQVVFQNNRR